MADLLIKKSAVKEAAQDMNVSADFYEALDREARNLVKRAAKRAQANGRKTVKARDC